MLPMIQQILTLTPALSRVESIDKNERPTRHRDQPWTLKLNRSKAHHISMANAQHENNDTYRLHRVKPDSPVSVLNQDGFFMAQYNPVTGATAWHRVVPATKRESIEKRLAQEFPTKSSK